MEKALLLERQSRKQWMAMAALFTVNGSIILFGNDLMNFRLAIGAVMILVSVCYLVYAVIGFSIKSKYAAKIRVTDRQIEWKTSFWSHSITLNWQDIKTIQFGNYTVRFELADGMKTIQYDTSAERSIQLKQLIRESAEPRKIQLEGG